MTGPKRDQIAALTTQTIILASTTFWSVLVAPYLWKRFGPAPSIIGVLLALLSMVFLLITEFKDPGVLMRDKEYPKPEAVQNEAKEAPDESKVHMNDINSPVPIENVEEQPQAPATITKLHIYETRWCITCNIWRPPKASHCRYCDNCVRGFDHHCVFVNNCIGERNLRYFVSFLLTTSIWSIYTLAWILVYYIMHLSENELVKHRMSIYYGFLVAGGALFAVSAGIFPCFAKSKWVILPLLLGILVFVVGWFLIIPFPDFFTTPLPILLAFETVLILFWVGGMTVKYIRYMLLNLTEKEAVAFSRVDIGVKKEIVHCKEKMKNVRNFFCRTLPSSELGVL